jgi:hypothetical protein
MFFLGFMNEFRVLFPPVSKWVPERWVIPKRLILVVNGARKPEQLILMNVIKSISGSHMGDSVETRDWFWKIGISCTDYAMLFFLTIMLCSYFWPFNRLPIFAHTAFYAWLRQNSGGTGVGTTHAPLQIHRLCYVLFSDDYAMLLFLAIQQTTYICSYGLLCVIEAKFRTYRGRDHTCSFANSPIMLCSFFWPFNWLPIFAHTTHILDCLRQKSG